jgi:hypothetical protein
MSSVADDLARVAFNIVKVEKIKEAISPVTEPVNEEVTGGEEVECDGECLSEFLCCCVVM